jgi:hypothetical protein
MERIQDNRRIILILLVALLLVCLLGVLAYNVFVAGRGGGEVAGEPPTATPVPTEEVAEAGATPVEEATPTPTRVVAGAPTEAPTTEPTSEATTEATTGPTPTPQPTPTPTSSEELAAAPGGTTLIEVPDTSQIEDILRNGNFEAGFDDRGVAQQWEIFKTDAANYAFSQETAEPFVQDGSSAQRISVENAVEADRYGGIYQMVEVVPGEVYTLTLHGQIRSGFGDVEASGYGYRIQYGLDFEGGTDWRTIPADHWVELPWDDQLLGGTEFEFSTHTAELTATSDKLTLFVRVWNKWPIQSLAEYTLDNLSLVGPVPGKVMLVSVETGEVAEGSPPTQLGATGGEIPAEEVLIDQPLPVTGLGGEPNFMEDGRFWAGVIILVLLAAGALFRARWGR